MYYQRRRRGRCGRFTAIILVDEQAGSDLLDGTVKGAAAFEAALGREGDGAAAAVLADELAECR